MTIENSSVNNPIYKVKLKFFKILTVIILFLIFICNYGFIINKITYLFEEYYYGKNAFKQVEVVLKTRLFLLNNSLCRNGIYYQSSVESLINFYIRQWCFDKAEYIYKKYINIPNDDFNKFQYYKDLSYILQKEKKYLESKSDLEKANILNENSNKFHYDLSEEFLLLFLEIDDEHILSDFFESIEMQKNKGNNFNYYLILKYIKYNDYFSAKKIIEKELVSTSKDLKLYKVAVPTKYLNIFVNEIYRNTLRKLLIKILIKENEKEEAKKILTDLTLSEEEIYGYYSPENYCNTYYMQKLSNTNSEQNKLQNIALKLLIFEGVNLNNIYKESETLCKY